MSLDLAYNILNTVGADILYRRARPPRGVVFMCHRVGDPTGREFEPNGKWRISAEQLELAILCAEEMGFEPVSCMPSAPMEQI